MDATTPEQQRFLNTAIERLRALWALIVREPALIVAHIMILPTLVSFVISSHGLPAWRYYGTILALSGLIVLNSLPGRERRIVDRGAPGSWTFLLLSAALFLASFWLSDTPSFIPFVLFLLVGQGVWSQRLPLALIYTAGLTGAFLAIIALESTWAIALDALGSIIPGILFTLIFTLLTTRYGEQTDRAEALLSQLKEANIELQAAREREKTLAVAEERVRLARDIHDGLGHHLTVLNVQLQAADKLVRRDPERAAQAIGICREVAQAALDEVRQSVAALRRTPLDGRSLDEALAALVKDFDHRSPLVASFEQRGAPADLTPAAAQTLFRAAQEGLTNVQKHAEAANVAVVLSYDAGSASLSVLDDGRGTSGQAADEQAGGFGLVALRERAEQLGGALRAEPRPEGGFLLELAVPTMEARGRDHHDTMTR